MMYTYTYTYTYIHCARVRVVVEVLGRELLNGNCQRRVEGGGVMVVTKIPADGARWVAV
jgi:hypothetical protein